MGGSFLLKLQISILRECEALGSTASIAKKKNKASKEPFSPNPQRVFTYFLAGSVLKQVTLLPELSRSQITRSTYRSIALEPALLLAQTPDTLIKGRELKT